MAGVPEAAFLIIVMGGQMLFIAEMYYYLPITVVLYWLAKEFTKRDPDWMDLLLRYLDEKHSYDSLPRPDYFLNKRVLGWGKKLPC